MHASEFEAKGNKGKSNFCPERHSRDCVSIDWLTIVIAVVFFSMLIQSKRDTHTAKSVRQTRDIASLSMYQRTCILLPANSQTRFECNRKKVKARVKTTDKSWKPLSALARQQSGRVYEEKDRINLTINEEESKDIGGFISKRRTVSKALSVDGKVETGREKHNDTTKENGEKIRWPC